MRAGAPYGTTRKITKLTKMGSKMRSGTKKALKSIFGKKETYSPVRMDVESPATSKGTFTLKNNKDALEGWGEMDEEETIVPKEFLKGPRDLPPDYTPPKIHKILNLHGSSINERFILPPNIEVVIFTKRGQSLWSNMTALFFKWISKNYAELMNSDMEKYHLKTFVQKTGRETASYIATAELGAKSHPEFSSSRRFNLLNIFSGTIQIFRGGKPCPNIDLQNDILGKEGLNGTAGFWDIGKKGEGDVVIPLKRDDTSTESFLKAIPYPHMISLKNLVNTDAFKNEGHLRLYLFCCRVEYKGQEASNSQASDASQGKLYINKEGEVTQSRWSRGAHSKGKRSLSKSRR
jgi:hypothetical protein